MDEINILYSDFLLLKELKVDLKIKKYILKEFLEAFPNPWKIIGITESALLALKNNSYKIKSSITGKNLSIQRAHIYDRSKWYEELFNTEWSSHIDWYDFIISRDVTVLALSSENKKISSIPYIRFPDNHNLFRSSRITWSHGIEEIEFLKGL